MRKFILLNVGPVVVSDEVRNALLKPDICHREAEFIEILNKVRKKLVKVFRGNKQYTVVLLGGSGTASLESVLSSVPRNGRVLFLSNGYYGEKMWKIAQIHNLDMRILKYEWGRRIRESDVEKLLESDPKIKYIAMVHNETSTAMLNQMTKIGELASKYGKIFIVDAISSVGVEDIDVVRDNIHFCIGSPNKCIESIPGLSFVCADKQELEKLRVFPPKSSYLDLYTYYVYEEGLGERLGTPFTPPVQAFYALDVALDLLLEEGIENRRKRYAYLAKIIRDGIENLGFKLFIPREFMCNSITSVLTPKNITYKILHDKLKKRGFIIYAGQGHVEDKLFRIGNMGALTVKDIKSFLETLEDILKNLKVRPQY